LVNCQDKTAVHILSKNKDVTFSDELFKQTQYVSSLVCQMIVTIKITFTLTCLYTMQKYPRWIYFFVVHLSDFRFCRCNVLLSCSLLIFLLTTFCDRVWRRLQRVISEVAIRTGKRVDLEAFQQGEFSW